MTLLPRSPIEVVVRCDLYAKEGYQTQSAVVERQKWMLEKELLGLLQANVSHKSTKTSFAYQCGGMFRCFIFVKATADQSDLGRTIDLFAILAQHQRNEKLAKKKLQPAIRVSAMADIDEEAAAVCDAIDGMAESPSFENCSRMSSFPQTLEW